MLKKLFLNIKTVKLSVFASAGCRTQVLLIDIILRDANMKFNLRTKLVPWLIEFEVLTDDG